MPSSTEILNRVFDSGNNRLNTSGGGSSASGVVTSVKQSCDFYETSKIEPFFGAGVNSGSAANIAGEAKHPGVIKFVSSTSTGSGYRVAGSGSQNQYLLSGGEEYHAVFQPITNATVDTYIGFINMTTSTDPTHGAYIKISNGTAVGKTANASTYSTTGTSLALTQGTWYHAKVAVTSSSVVTFTIYSESGTSLWTDTLTTNIPTANATSHGILSASSGTTAIDLIKLDLVVLCHNLVRGGA